MTTDLKRKLKELLIERLKFEDMTPDDIPDDEPLFAGGLGLDSIDALEIVVMLESEFGLKIKNESSAREHFRSIASLASFVKERTAALLYLDAEADPLPHPNIPMMLRVTAKAGFAFELLLLRSKIREI